MKKKQRVATLDEHQPKRAFAWERFLPTFLVISGGLGFIASLSLMLEKIASLEQPGRVPLCDINPILSCGSVMDSAQASLFGIPHSLLGVGIFAALMTLGIALIAGARLKPWFWNAVLGASLIGFISVQYLVYQSLFVIRALCPWCMVIWVAVVPIMFGVIAYGVRQQIFQFKQPAVQPTLRFIAKHNVTIIAVWFIIVVYMIIVQFWYYFSTLL